MVRGLSYSPACGIFLDHGSNPLSPAMAGGFLSPLQEVQHKLILGLLRHVFSRPFSHTSSFPQPSSRRLFLPHTYTPGSTQPQDNSFIPLSLRNLPISPWAAFITSPDCLPLLHPRKKLFPSPSSGPSCSFHTPLFFLPDLAVFLHYCPLKAKCMLILLPPP